MQQPRLFSALAALTCLCGAVSAPNAQAAPTTRVVSQVPGLAHAQSIAIDDVWNGFNRAAPIEAHYVLQRGAGGFRGHADFSAGRGYPGGPRQAHADIEIPQAAIERFFAVLAQSPLRPGPYAPARGHTDDYPDLTITLALDGRNVVFASQSQGRERKPWQVQIDGREFVSDSGQPAAALGLLQPYLKRDALNAILEQLKR